LVAYQSGDRSLLSLEFTSTPARAALFLNAHFWQHRRAGIEVLRPLNEFTSTLPHAKNCCTFYECPFSAAYESGDQSSLSFEFTSTSLRPKNSRATSKCPLLVFKSGSWFGPLANQNLTVLDRTDGPVQGSP
jgi:hypothetical protein